jgi:hypothetical protein
MIAACRSSEPANILTYSWDRLLIDPLPGPRDPSSFEALERVGRYNYRVLPKSVPKPPSGSTLPRLASDLPATLWLIDPRRGAVGLSEQIRELMRLLNTDAIEVVDVGGDILATQPEHTAHGALADTLVLASIGAIEADVTVLLAGMGLDGESPPEYLSRRSKAIRSQAALYVIREAVEEFRHIFEWHPSEVTGLLWAAAMGARGVAEIRSAGLRVSLEDESTRIDTASAQDIILNNPLVAAVTDTRSLLEAEAALRLIGCPSEIDFERKKASKIRSQKPHLKSDAHALVSNARSLAKPKRSQGVDFLTLRRLFEMLETDLITYPDLHEQLREVGAREYRPPLWVLNHLAWPDVQFTLK